MIKNIVILIINKQTELYSNMLRGDGLIVSFIHNILFTLGAYNENQTFFNSNTSEP